MNDVNETQLTPLVQTTGYHPKGSQTLLSILAEHGLHYDHIEQVPAKLAREIQRRQIFKDYRSIELPAPIIRESLNQSILEELLVTRIGYCSQAAGHYIPRPQGSLDHVLLYCVAGKGWCQIGGKHWVIPKGSALLIPSGIPHLYGAASNDPWSIYWIHFSGRTSPEYCSLLDVNTMTPLFRLPISEDILSAFEATYKALNSAQNRINLVLGTGSLARFLALANLKRRSMDARSHTAEDKVQETVRFMHENIDGVYSLREFAQMAKMSQRHYCQIFRKKHGWSPMEYFTRIKIQKSCHLLLNTSLQVRQIAHSLGYKDPYYFSRTFRKIIGTSPADYRYRTSPPDTEKNPNENIDG